jgi:hypothetical protein
MRDTELYWLAGLLEGEGSFMRPPPSSPNQPVIGLQMTDEDVIEKVSSLVGVGYRRVRYNHPEWKPVYALQVRGGRAVRLMRELSPFMGERRRGQIDRALAGYDPFLSQQRRLKLPSPEELRVMLKTSTTRELGKRLGCSRQTISRRSRIGL